MAGKQTMWVCGILLACVAAALGASLDLHVESLVTAIELGEFDYEDKCLELADVQWECLNSGSRASSYMRQLKWHRMMEMAKVKRDTFQYLRGITNYVPTEIKELFDLASYPGDELLDDEDYQQKVNYTFLLEHRATSELVPCYSAAECSMKLQDISRVLAKSGDAAELKHAWRQWNIAAKPDAPDYLKQLGLLSKAAKANGINDTVEYWLKLQEMDVFSMADGYELAQDMWNEIQPLYESLHKYVSSRLQYHLELFPANIPTYLTGSLLGEDWSSMADLVVPPGDPTFTTLQERLAKKKHRQLYEMASRILQDVGLEKISQDFLKNIRFNGTCPPQSVRSCKGSTLRVSTCREVDWTQYLDAHEIVARAMHDHLSSEKSQLLRKSNRYSALLDAVPGMMTLLAASETHLKHLKLIDENSDTDEYDDEPENKVLLLLMALRYLPRLPFYLMADKWRLHMLQSENTNDFSSWSKFRSEYQMINSSSGEVQDVTFLSDSYIISNRPYLVKFMATVFQFQLLNYFVEGDPSNPIEEVKERDELSTLMAKEQSMKWPDLIKILFDMNGVNTESLLNYFAPLKKLLEEPMPSDAPKIARKQVEVASLVTNATVDGNEDRVESQEISEVSKVSTSQEPPTTTEGIEAVQETNITAVNNSSSNHNSTVESASSGTSMTILFASLVVFGLAVTAGIFVGARQCYKRKYNRNRRPQSER